MKYSIDKSTLVNIANSIREKTNQKESLKLEKIPRQINNLILDENSDICFYDYDGTLVYTYSFDELAKLSELPPGPVHEGLIFQEWNWTLEGLKNLNGLKMDVGPSYITDDGKTRIYLNNYTKFELNVPVRIWQSVANGVEIDWGDGSPIETNSSAGAIKIYHNYKPGKYVLTFNPIGDCELRLNGHQTEDLDPWGFMQESHYDIYSNLFYKIELGRNVFRLSKQITNYADTLETITIPKETTTFEKRCLFNARALKIFCPPRGSNLGNAGIAMSGNNGLKLVTFPESYAQNYGTIGGHCFTLERIRLPHNATGTGHWGESHCLREVVLPSSITFFSGGAFGNCYVLESIKFQNNDNSKVVTIDQGAFNGCRLLKNFEIPPNVTYIGDTAFGACYCLADIRIPEKVTSLGPNVFSNCQSLVSVNIPKSITSIPATLFTACYSLKEIDFSTHTQVPTLGSTNSFNGVPNTCKFLVPKALEAEWKSATNWATFADMIVGI